MEALGSVQVFEVGVWVRGFDILTGRKHSPDETRSGIYQYNKADIILGQKSMVLLGKNTYFGGVIHIIPVELIVKEKQAAIRTAWMKEWTEQNGRITIAIVDEHYNKPFKIDFKDHVEQIREWLVTIGATRM